MTCFWRPLSYRMLGPLQNHSEILDGRSFHSISPEAFEKATVSPLSDESNPLLILTNEVRWHSGRPIFCPLTASRKMGRLCNLSRWPLVIDPQLQGIRWLRAKEGQPERHLQIVRLSQKDVIRKLTGALEMDSLIIENLGETLDAVLNPVIQRYDKERTNCT